MVRIIIIAISILLVFESVVLMLNTRINIGTAFVYFLTLLSVMYAVFFDSINDFSRAGIGRIFAVVLCGALLFYIVMFIIVSTVKSPIASGEEKAVIVLGAGLHGEEVSETLRHRLDGAIEFYNSNEGVTLCVTGSKGRFELIPEAVAMERYLLSNGIPAEDILVDPNSDDTKQNIENAMKLFEENDIDTESGVAIVTNRFHCYRALSYAEQQGVNNATAVPTSIPLLAIHSSHSREVFALLKHQLFER